MSQLYFKQLLGGVDFGRANAFAQQMENFVYLIGDTETRECVVVDPAWAVQDIVDVANNDGMKIIGALATHYHPDHVGGNIYGIEIEGVAKLLSINPCPIHTHKEEAFGIRRVTGVSANDIVEHHSGDVVKVGSVEIELLHTPGHTPGSMCFRLKNALVSGDTLFLNGCGRVDLPGGDQDEMFRTLNERLSTLPDTMELYPGHAYGGIHAPLADVRKKNPMLKIHNIDTWHRVQSMRG